MSSIIDTHPMVTSAKPFTRWWWFSGDIQKEVIDTQLMWIQEMGFGGVEIAWVYPQGPEPKDSELRFLDSDWQELVSYTLHKAKSMNLGCDVTFGTVWPFGGTFVPEHYSSRTFKGYSSQRITKSWEKRYATESGRVLDHLNADAFRFYSEYLLNRGFKHFAKTSPISFFCDSLEVDTQDISYSELHEDFIRLYGYSLKSYVTTGLDNFPEVRFDYRKLLSIQLLKAFYEPYTEMCRKHKVLSRIQAHGAFTDLIDAYGLADIPESETLLFHPGFSQIPASSAAIYGHTIISCESFTCIYGWVPSPNKPPGLKNEIIQDLLVLADAQFANGINQIIWHGMPYSDWSNENYLDFYATVHVGKDGNLSKDLQWFNSYLENRSIYLRLGTPFFGIGYYLPLEDSWMSHKIPENRQHISNEYFWELQELRIPKDLKPYHPIYLNKTALKKCTIKNGSLIFEGFSIPGLYIDATWLEKDTLEIIGYLSKRGAKIWMKNLPQEPGLVKHDDYKKLSRALFNTHSLKSENTFREIGPILTLDGEPDFWIRKVESKYLFFIAHPDTQNLRYPMNPGFSLNYKDQHMEGFIHIENKTIPIQLSFSKGQGVLLEVLFKENSYRIINC